MRTATSAVSNHGSAHVLDIDWSDAGEVPDIEWKDPNGKGIPFSRVLDALRYVDPVERESWRKAGAALKLAYGDEAFPLWDLWSAHAGDAYGGTEGCQKTWDSHNRENGDHAVTPLTILKLARNAGWRPSVERSNEDDFDRPAKVGGQRDEKKHAESEDEFRIRLLSKPVFSPTDFATMEIDPSQTLLGLRYLCPKGSMLWVAGTGTGKSTL